MHDKAQEHLKLNQEYRSQMNDYLSSTSNLPTTAKKKRTTSSSSTSSTSSSKADEQNTPSMLPNPTQPINFFSTSSHPPQTKIKKSSNRQFAKYDRRVEQHVQENQTHLEEMNMHLKNLQLMSSNETTTNKNPMRINTDTQKALEHLRQLASNPSALEHVLTLANNPNIIKEIQRYANQKPFIEQFKTLQSTTEKKGLVPTEHDPTIVSSQSNLPHESTDLPLPSSPSTCCAEHSSQLTHSSSTALSHLRFQNRIDVDCETESNHDTALTLACAGGHEELVLLLLQRNANIEHRDKKGFTPLILAGKSLSYN